jgi:hypothetical protein
MALDLVVARAVAQAKLLERAVHDPGPWEIEVGGVRQLALKAVDPTKVIIFATFPPVCWIDPPDVARLYCRGEMVGSREIVPPSDDVFTVHWYIGLDLSSFDNTAQAVTGGQ